MADNINVLGLADLLLTVPSRHLLVQNQHQSNVETPEQCVNHITLFPPEIIRKP